MAQIFGAPSSSCETAEFKNSCDLLHIDFWSHAARTGLEGAGGESTCAVDVGCVSLENPD